MCEERTDRDLVDLANRGDQGAMEALYRRYRDWVYGQAYRSCGNRDDALDITQQVFIYFLGKFPGFQLRSQVKTFLYPVIRHRVADLMRSRQRRQEIAAGIEPLSPKARSLPQDALMDMVVSLPPEQRDVILLRFGEDLKLSEIAEKLEIPAGTVKSRLHHALEKLRKTM